MTTISYVTSIGLDTQMFYSNKTSNKLHQLTSL